MTIPGIIRCDVVVVGGGPAGIAAGTRAAEAGARVIIIDSGMHPGGQIWRHHDRASLPGLAKRWLKRSELARVQWMLEATVVDGSVERGLTVSTQRMLRVRDTVHCAGTYVVSALKVILATGARELFLPYPGWTLPNAMGVGGAQAMLKGSLDVRGRRVIVAGSGPLLLPVAAAMAESGAHVVAFAEQVPLRKLAAFALSLWSQPAKGLLATHYGSAVSIPVYHTGTWVERADGDGHIQSVTLTNGRRRWTELCDVLCCSYGLIPGTELASLLGCTVADGGVVVDAFQRTTVDGVLSAGESTGVAGDAAAIAEGEIAGLTATAGDAIRIPGGLRRRQEQGRRFAMRIASTFQPRAELRTLVRPDTVVCRCEDVRFGQLDTAWSGRQAKLYARVGMGPCQGAVCGPGLAHLLGWSAVSVRPPLFAPSLGEWIADDVTQVAPV